MSRSAAPTRSRTGPEPTSPACHAIVPRTTAGPLPSSRVAVADSLSGKSAESVNAAPTPNTSRARRTRPATQPTATTPRLR
ncbi:hypothetical protein ACIA5G_52715 [Amycolatopsis sp. NPDC051758]|uniref:hypothetical protein n=1 Tax=Amycolatopsis sp. NPDC051758 TaxID=3363935 RepID=UPI0037B0A4A8